MFKQVLIFVFLSALVAIAIFDETPSLEEEGKSDTETVTSF